MIFIKITNYETSVNRLHLEKLGLSTKRDDVETIGQFGSGIKYAPIAALRKGLRWVFAGSDAKGNYLMEYIIKDDEGIPSIFYKYEDYEKASSFTPDAGVLSWEDPYQIVREVIANAIDQAHTTDTAWDLSIVNEDEITSVDGEFSVYISVDESLLEIIDNFDMYFTVNRTPIYTKPGNYTGFKVYKKIGNDEYLRVYSKGILVFCSKDVDNLIGSRLSMFDYEFNDIQLNEERRIRSEYDMHWRISSALFGLNDENIISQIIKKILSSEKYYEFETMSHNLYCRSSAVPSPEWFNVSKEIFDKNVVLTAKEATINAKLSVKSRGYDPIILENEGKIGFLTTIGVKTTKDILGEQFQYEYTKDISDRKKLMKAVEIITDVFPETSLAYPDKLGILTQNVEDISGMTLNMGKPIEHRFILIQLNDEKDTVYDILMTLFHEFDHFKTGCVDGDLNGREFRELADDHLAELTIRYYQMKHGLDENDISWW